MKKRILLPAILCMAISIFTASCSSDDIESPEAKEQMVTLTVSAGTEDAAAATRAVLSEADAAKSPWKWEQGDKILLVSGNRVSALSIKKMKRDGLSAEFEGQVPASSLTNGGSYRFFYVGKNSDGTGDRTVDASKGSINIDLTKQTGALKDLKRNCVLTGTGKVSVSVSDNKATTEGDIVLSNVFAVAHFAVQTRNNATLTKVGLRGKGVYASANVDLSTGAVTGVSEIGTEVDPETNIFFPTNDFYVTFVPGTVAPAFDGYYSGSYTDVVKAPIEARNYDESKSFVYYKGKKAKFSVSATQQVAITNGNMQYVMPIATYTFEMKPRMLTANTLIRWKKEVPLKVTATSKVHPGYYQLAPEQWEMAIPKASRKKEDYHIGFVTVGSEKYVSPEKYRIFDLPSWGTLDNPTLLKNKFSATTDQDVNKYDYGHKLRVGDKDTRVMTAKEWEYLMNNYVDIALPKNNNRVWNGSGVKAAKWARCHIKATSEQRAGEEVWLRGCLIFPDDMPYSEARALFTSVDKFGHWSKADANETTFAKIRNSGAVFIPFTAYRQSGTNVLKQWGIHGNYATSSRNGRSVYHVKITPYPIDNINFYEGSDADQGCASRLVQNY